MENDQEQTLFETLASTKVVTLVLKSVLLNPELKQIFVCPMCHVYILITNEKEVTGTTVQYQFFLEQSIGNKKDWPHAFDIFARFRARQILTNTDVANELERVVGHQEVSYFKQSDGVRRGHLVVACAGALPRYINKMLAGIIADTLEASAWYHYEQMKIYSHR